MYYFSKLNSITIAMNASVTMQQEGQSKKMAEARLSSFEERKTIFPFLQCVYNFLALSIVANF